MKIVHSLGGNWKFRQSGQSEIHPAIVPGCIHDDLLANDLIPDPYFGENEKDLQWIGETSWIYSRTFNLPEEFRSREQIVLRCEGLDTLARVLINGKEVGCTDNMFRTWEWNIKTLLDGGDNLIEFHFESVMPLLREKESEKKMFSWPGAGGISYKGSAYVRKMACNFGWDWGPKLVSAGIWKDIALVAWDRGRITEVDIRQRHENGQVSLAVDVSAPGSDSVHVSVTLVPQKTGKTSSKPIPVAGLEKQSGTGSLELPIPEPQLWWPNDLGGQPLYEVHVESRAKDGAVLDRQTRRIGLRTIELQRFPDQWGESFQFAVNGIPFFAKGANWIPTDPFPSRERPERVRDLLGAAASAHMNMIRVWGGGVYADENFLDICDELGLLVWHDFMFACSTYPAFDESFLRNVEAEARDAVLRIRHRACLALWCGNNELEQGIVADSWTDRTMSWEDYKKIFDEILPRVVAELNPATAYWPCSPHSPKDRLNFNNPREGDAHLWDVWFTDAPFESYRTCEHRFNSEFGFQSFPELKTVCSFAKPSDWNISSAVFEHHQRSSPGNARIFQKIMDWFRVPKDFESTLILSQICQALAIGYGVEHWRRSMPRGMGTLYWQLNDNWPATSWSSLDSFGRWKALHYAARRFYAPLLISGVDQDGSIEVHVTSDLLEETAAKLLWTITDLTGTIHDNGTLLLQCPARHSEKVLDLHPDIKSHGSRNLITWLRLESGGQIVSEANIVSDRPRRMEWSDPEIKFTLTETGGQISIHLTVQRPAFWVWLELAEDDTVFSDNFFAMRPGEAKVVVFPRPPGSTLTRLQKTLFIRSLFDTY